MAAMWPYWGACDGAVGAPIRFAWNGGGTADGVGAPFAGLCTFSWFMVGAGPLALPALPDIRLSRSMAMRPAEFDQVEPMATAAEPAVLESASRSPEVPLGLEVALWAALEWLALSGCSRLLPKAGWRMLSGGVEKTLTC